MAQNIRISFDGRLVRDPARTKSGKYACTIACDQFKNSENEHTQFIGVLGITEGLAKHLFKGRHIVIENAPLTEPSVYEGKPQLTCLLDQGSKLSLGSMPKNSEREIPEEGSVEGDYDF